MRYQILSDFLNDDDEAPLKSIGQPLDHKGDAEIVYDFLCEAFPLAEFDIKEVK